eukprot:TRINITY_DN67135_c1_g11_i1.p1 TRINITY_DN67135_c1_g11~~TRINITY_DN67135_c1_g11_i1.p1  ORF type:complete len:1040 (+),score=170.43 TRINITY_DN67135_c1_g11_i1:98-3217(+)
MDVLHKELAKHDHNSSGTIPVSAFRGILAKFGVHDGLQPLVKKFGNTNGPNGVNYNAFLAHFDQVKSAQVKTAGDSTMNRSRTPEQRAQRSWRLRNQHSTSWGSDPSELQQPSARQELTYSAPPPPEDTEPYAMPNWAYQHDKDILGQHIHDPTSPNQPSLKTRMEHTSVMGHNPLATSIATPDKRMSQKPSMRGVVEGTSDPLCQKDPTVATSPYPEDAAGYRNNAPRPPCSKKTYQAFVPASSHHGHLTSPSSLDSAAANLPAARLFEAPPEQTQSEAALKQLFNQKMDTNNDGTATYGTVASELKSLGVPLSDESMKNIFAQVDPQGSGKLDYNQFERVLQHSAVEGPPASTATTGAAPIELHPINPPIKTGKKQVRPQSPSTPSAQRRHSAPQQRGERVAKDRAAAATENNKKLIKQVLATELVNATAGNVQQFGDKINEALGGKGKSQKLNANNFKQALTAIFPNSSKLPPWLLDTAVTLAKDKGGKDSVNPNTFLSNLGLVGGSNGDEVATRAAQQWSEHKKPNSRNPLFKGPVDRETTDEKLLYDSTTYSAATGPAYPHTSSGRNIIACDVSDARTDAYGYSHLGRAKITFPGAAIAEANPDNIVAHPCQEELEGGNMDRNGIRLFPEHHINAESNEDGIWVPPTRKARGGLTPPPRGYNLINGQGDLLPDGTVTPISVSSPLASNPSGGYYEERVATGKRMGIGKYTPQVESSEWTEKQKGGRKMCSRNGEPLKDINMNPYPELTDIPRGTKHVMNPVPDQVDLAAPWEDSPTEVIRTQKTGKRFNHRVLQTTMPMMVEGTIPPGESGCVTPRTTNMNVASHVTEVKEFQRKGRPRSRSAPHADNRPAPSVPTLKRAIQRKLEQQNGNVTTAWKALSKACTGPNRPNARSSAGITAGDVAHTLHSQFNLNVSEAQVRAVFAAEDSGQSSNGAVTFHDFQRIFNSSQGRSTTPRYSSPQAPFATDFDPPSRSATPSNARTRSPRAGHETPTSGGNGAWAASPVPPYAVGPFGEPRAETRAVSPRNPITHADC